MKIEKISTLVLWALMAVTAVTFVLFFILGPELDADGEPIKIGKNVVPSMTEPVMWVIVALFIVGAIGLLYMLIYSCKTVLSNKIKGTPSSSGVPGFAIGILMVVLLGGSMLLGWIMSAGSEPHIDKITQKELATASEVQMVSTFCISIGVLFVAAIASVAISMTGILTKVGRAGK